MAWKMIEGYKHPYRISNEGEVQSYYNGSWRTMKPNISGLKRAHVDLMRKDGTRYRAAIVNLMADAFMGGRRAGYNIVHENGDKLNFNLWNLKHVPKAKTSANRARRRPVIKIDRDGNELEIYPSAKAAADANFISQSAVTAHCRGEMNNPFMRCDFDFRYEDKEGAVKLKYKRGKKNGRQRKV